MLLVIFVGSLMANTVDATSICLNSNSPHKAKEILNRLTKTVYVASKPNPINDKQWQSFHPRIPFKKNSTRHLLFGKSCFTRSYSQPQNCKGDQCKKIKKISGYTWLELAKIVGHHCIPKSIRCSMEGGTPDALSAITIKKCQTITFENKIYDLSDSNGNHFIMHATATAKPTMHVDLPKGWHLKIIRLKQALTIHPKNNSSCIYTILRDSKQQSYHQYIYAGTGKSYYYRTGNLFYSSN